MGSTYLKHFLGNVGDTIHSLNTICVGLSAVGSKMAVKPADLVVTWDPKDVKLSSIQSRLYAVKSAYVFLAESVYQYMQSVKSIMISSENAQAFSEAKNSKKVRMMFQGLIDSDESYREPLLILLVHTRNSIVHRSSKASLSKGEKAILLESEAVIRKKHSGLEIRKLLDHLSNGKFTLKDVSSIAANTITMVRLLDEKFCSTISSAHQALSLLENTVNPEAWCKLVNRQPSERRKKKIDHYIEVTLPYVSEDILNELKNQYV